MNGPTNTPELDHRRALPPPWMVLARDYRDHASAAKAAAVAQRRAGGSSEAIWAMEAEAADFIVLAASIERDAHGLPPFGVAWPC